jgi:hypothetical protein
VTPGQRADAVRYRSNGAKMIECAHMVGVTWEDYAADWKRGASDLTTGRRDTDQATFVRDSREGFARHCATIRAEAVATAGSRESADRLAYLRDLLAEAEPLDEVDEADWRDTDPGFLTRHPDPAVREAAAVALKANLDLLHALAAPPPGTHNRG